MSLMGSEHVQDAKVTQAVCLWQLVMTFCQERPRSRRNDSVCLNPTLPKLDPTLDGAFIFSFWVDCLNVTCRYNEDSVYK